MLSVSMQSFVTLSFVKLRVNVPSVTTLIVITLGVILHNGIAQIIGKQSAILLTAIMLTIITLYAVSLCPVSLR
jgi:hypothetical protein